MYYYLTKAQYDAISSQVSHDPAWTLDNSHCIVHNDNNITITNYTTHYATANDVNDWRFDPDTDEWQNWMTDAERNGTI